eukprot:2057690-Ditylum_brightwellii.AAC.1
MLGKLEDLIDHLDLLEYSLKMYNNRVSCREQTQVKVKEEKDKTMALMAEIQTIKSIISQGLSRRNDPPQSKQQWQVQGATGLEIPKHR